MRRKRTEIQHPTIPCLDRNQEESRPSLSPLQESHDRLFLWTSNTLRSLCILALRHLTYSMTASFSTTNRHPPTKLRPHFSCRRPRGANLPALFVQDVGRAKRRTSPEISARVGKARAPMMIYATAVVEKERRRSFCWGCAAAAAAAAAG